ncbi:hypothetical protein D3C86_1370830 [compost metagenome]
MIYNLKIIKTNDHKIQMKVFQNKEALKPFKENLKIHEYKISGKGSIKVQW